MRAPASAAGARGRTLWRALAPLLEAESPEVLRRLEARLILRTFARAIGVEPPRTRGLDTDGTLAVLREFSAACAELAWEREPVATVLRTSLREEAEALGTCVRTHFRVRDEHAGALARYLYRGIRIELDIDGDELAFGPCSFASRYTPRACWLMSGFDEGFLGGLLGVDDARLLFSCRMSAGAPRCRARLEGGDGSSRAPKALKEHQASRVRHVPHASEEDMR